jgi:hypothetical protein
MELNWGICSKSCKSTKASTPGQGESPWSWRHFIISDLENCYAVFWTSKMITSNGCIIILAWTWYELRNKYVAAVVLQHHQDSKPEFHARYLYSSLPRCNFWHQIKGICLDIVAPDNVFCILAMDYCGGLFMAWHYWWGKSPSGPYKFVPIGSSASLNVWISSALNWSKLSEWCWRVCNSNPRN